MTQNEATARESAMLDYVNAARAQHEQPPLVSMTKASRSEVLWGLRRAVATLQNTAALDGGIRQEAEAVTSPHNTPASRTGLPNSCDGGVPADVVALKALRAIADGYGYRIAAGFIVVENPKFEEDNGSNPKLVIELASAQQRPCGMSYGACVDSEHNMGDGAGDKNLLTNDESLVGSEHKALPSPTISREEAVKLIAQHIYAFSPDTESFTGKIKPMGEHHAANDDARTLYHALSPYLNGGWMDISSAPKDGTTVLLCTTEVEDGHHQTAYYEENPGNKDFVWHATDSDSFWHKDMFTHWMPLPKSPEALQSPKEPA